MFKIKKPVFISLCLFCAILFTSCGQSISVNTINDRQGNQIDLSNPPQTIISLAPSITQILIDLGLEEKIIAVDTYSQNLLKSQDSVKVFDIMNPDIEVLASLESDILFASEMSKAGGDDPLKPVRDIGTTVTYIPTSETIDEIKSDIIFIAEVNGLKKEGQDIIDNMEVIIEQYKQIGQTITNKKTVYFEIAPAPYMYSFGSEVYLNEIIQIIGAENVLSKEKGWLNVSEEAIISSNPDVIITSVDYVDNPTLEIMSRAGYENINAVKNNQVYFINPNKSSQPNHHIVYAMEDMARLIYPEEYDI